MPTVSRQQQKLMQGIATGSIKGGGAKPSRAVARKFAAADSKRGPTKLPQRVPQSGNVSTASTSSTSAMGAALPQAPSSSPRRNMGGGMGAGGY